MDCWFVGCLVFFREVVGEQPKNPSLQQCTTPPPCLLLVWVIDDERSLQTSPYPITEKQVTRKKILEAVLGGEKCFGGKRSAVPVLAEKWTVYRTRPPVCGIYNCSAVTHKERDICTPEPNGEKFELDIGETPTVLEPVGDRWSSVRSLARIHVVGNTVSTVEYR